MFKKSGFVPFGAEMPKQGVQKFTAKKGQTIIKILSTAQEHFLFSKTHYLEGVGYFHCFGGSCCQACADAGDKGSTSERAILPIAVYKPSLSGVPTLEFAYLPLSEQKYSALVNMNENIGVVTNYDIIIDCEDEKYQKYTFTPKISASPKMSAHPIIDSIADSQAKVATFLAEYSANIMKTLGKTIDELEFNKLRAQALQKAANNVGVTFQPNATASQAFVQPQVALPQQQTPVAAIATAQPTPQPIQTVVPPVSVPTAQVVAEAQAIAPAPTPEVQVTPAQPVVEEPTEVVVESVTADDWASMIAND